MQDRKQGRSKKTKEESEERTSQKATAKVGRSAEKEEVASSRPTGPSTPYQAKSSESESEIQSSERERKGRESEKNKPENAHLDIRLEYDEHVIGIVFDGIVAVGAKIERPSADSTAVPGSGDGDLPRRKRKGR